MKQSTTNAEYIDRRRSVDFMYVIALDPRNIDGCYSTDAPLEVTLQRPIIFIQQIRL